MANVDTCCFTGHKKLPANKIQNILSTLDEAIENLISQGVTNFISGGAVGFDLMAAALILAKKETGRTIRLIFVLPCKNQELLWDNKQKQLYRNLLNEADEIIYITENYNRFCIEQRNRYMVEHSNHCICALLYEKSGTYQTVRIAKKNGLKIINTIKQA